MNKFGAQLQQYAQGSDKCLHPINRVVDIGGGLEQCACGVVFGTKPHIDKDARIAALEEENAKLRAALEAAVDSMVKQKPLGTWEQVLKQARTLLAQEPA